MMTSNGALWQPRYATDVEIRIRGLRDGLRGRGGHSDTTRADHFSFFFSVKPLRYIVLRLTVGRKASITTALSAAPGISEEKTL